MVVVPESARAVDSHDLAEVEARFGFRFPSGLRKILLATNGGRPVNPLFRSNDDAFVVSQFLPVRHSLWGSRFESSCEALLENEIIRSLRLLPFAIDPGGDYFCFCTEGPDAGSIWFFCGEYIDEPDRAAVRIASGFEEFVGSLEADE